MLLSLFVLSAYPQTTDIDRMMTILPSHMGDKEFVLSKSAKAYRILSSTDNNGFVIISTGNNNDMSVLGYSDSGSWDESVMPPALLQWLKRLEENYVYAIRSTNKVLFDNGKKDIPILLTSRWHQDSPYNDMCPVIPDGNIKTVAGCVAIAASQVAYYWRKDNPLATSEATPTYPYGKAPVTYSIPAGTEYRWDLMKDFYTLFEPEDEKEAVARLTYIIGTSTYLNYGSSTGGQIYDIINPFYNQFRLNAKYATKDNYSQKEWEQLLYDNLKKKQPIVYAGSDGSGGHAVVIDGYNTTLNLFHFNFGWGGNGDGYYTVDDVTGMNGYMLGQDCVYDIYPLQRNIKISIDVADELYANITGEIDISIQNGSTFDIEGLCLFMSKNYMPPTNKADAIWCQEGRLKNDGSQRRFSVQFIPSFSSSKCYLVLTDGEMNILAQKSVTIQESSGIQDVLTIDNYFEELYSIKGEFLSKKPHPGIYVTRNKKGKSKIIIIK